MTSDRPIKPMTEARLEAGAFHYLARFSANEARLRDLLRRRISKRNPDFAAPDAEQRRWIEALVGKCKHLGLIDDGAFALVKARGLQARGKSVRHIRQWLKARGLAEEDITAAIRSLEEEAGSERTLEIEAALRLARRRRFGPFRQGAPTPDREKREIAAFARAGFGYGLARRIIDADSEDALDEMRDAARGDPMESEEFE